MSARLPPPSIFLYLQQNNTDVLCLRERIYTVSCGPFPPLCLVDGVELTGAESFTMPGSKDKLLNTRAEVTYVLVRLPDSFSSPARSISPSRFFVFSCFLPSSLLPLSHSVQ